MGHGTWYAAVFLAWASTPRPYDQLEGAKASTTIVPNFGVGPFLRSLCVGKI